MSRRARLVAYLVVAHVGAAYAAWRWLGSGAAWTWWIAELVLLVSLAVGIKLVVDVFAAVRFVDESTVLLATNDVMSRVRHVGQPEIDRLIDLYNSMIDHLRAERVAAREQQYFLAQVIAESPAAIVVFDFDRRVAHVNPAAHRVLGLDATSSGRSLADCAPWVSSVVDDITDGEPRIVSDASGRRVRIVSGSFIDRGFRRRFLLAEELTEEMRRLERAAHEKLIRVLSHEVNNTVGASASLLASCLTYAPHLPEGDRRDFEQAIDIVRNRTMQLGQFLSRFADVYRLPDPQLAPVGMRDLVDEVVGVMRGKAAEAGVELGMEVWDDWPVVTADRAQLGQVLVNVVKNAIEAAGPGGCVRLTHDVSEGTPRLLVEDSGPGLSDEARENLFTPFFSTKEGGQGVGLTFVREVLAQHGFACAFEQAEGRPHRFAIAFLRR